MRLLDRDIGSSGGIAVVGTFENTEPGTNIRVRISVEHIPSDAGEGVLVPREPFDHPRNKDPKRNRPLLLRMHANRQMGRPDATPKNLEKSEAGKPLTLGRRPVR